MKTYLTVAVAAILIGGSASAQHSAQKVNIGIKGGVNLTNIYTENSTKLDDKVGFNAGLLGHIHLTREIALQPEITYSLQGAKFPNTGAKLNLGYINVPILVQYMFDNGFRLQAGPQLGFLTTAKIKNASATEDIKSNYKPVDFGLSAGIGYVQPSSGLGLDLRYNLGISDITKSNLSKSANRGAQLGIFYLFNHAK
ncbi:MAG: PorT family protein [Aquabacterium sp.]|nr:PorT family protein [Ferruginibacter sp.]